MKFTLFLIALFLISVSSVYAMDMKGLVAYFSFDEGAGKVAKDASGNGNNGDIVGNVTWVAGKFGKAVKIADDGGANYVIVKANKTLDMTDQLTFGAWVNLETLPDGSCSLITKADTYMIHMSDWRKVAGEMDMEPLLWPFDAWQTPISMTIKLKEWHHVLGVFDGKELKTYIDGALKGKRAFASKIAVTANDLVIGRDSRACCNTRRAGLSVDDVVLFNKAITDAEAKELFAGISTPVQPQGLATTVWGQIKADF